jgi:hypothetical protein
MIILNLTQHAATDTQMNVGVCNAPSKELAELKEALNFVGLPTVSDLYCSADKIADIAYRLDATQVMIGGAPFFMPVLEAVLISKGFKVMYAFSERVSEESVSEDGTVTKINVFKHIGFYEV